MAGATEYINRASLSCSLEGRKESLLLAVEQHMGAPTRFEKYLLLPLRFSQKDLFTTNLISKPRP